MVRNATRNMAYALLAQTNVSVYATQAPDDDEWSTYLNYVIKHSRTFERMLIYTYGGAPTQHQREHGHRLRDQMREVRGAVVTSSAFVRTIYRVNQYESWHVFLPTEWDEAFRHLGIFDSKERIVLFSTVVELAATLGLPEPPGSKHDLG